MTKDFELSYSDMMGGFREQVQSQYPSIIYCLCVCGSVTVLIVMHPYSKIILSCNPSMTQLRDIENSHHERLTEIGTTVLEKFTKNQLEEEPHEDLRVVSQLPMVYTHSILYTGTEYGHCT